MLTYCSRAELLGPLATSEVFANRSSSKSPPQQGNSAQQDLLSHTRALLPSRGATTPFSSQRSLLSLSFLFPPFVPRLPYAPFVSRLQCSTHYVPRRSSSHQLPQMQLSHANVHVIQHCIVILIIPPPLFSRSRRTAFYLMYLMISLACSPMLPDTFDPRFH